jgi:hypothetical protein
VPDGKTFVDERIPHVQQTGYGTWASACRRHQASGPRDPQNEDRGQQELLDPLRRHPPGSERHERIDGNLSWRLLRHTEQREGKVSLRDEHQVVAKYITTSENRQQNDECDGQPGHKEGMSPAPAPEAFYDAATFSCRLNSSVSERVAGARTRSTNPNANRTTPRTGPKSGIKSLASSS